jgi:hypothetical protein
VGEVHREGQGEAPWGELGRTQRTRDRDTVKRWAKTAGVDLEAERAKEKLRNMDRARE